jgi:hypothetical protein
MTTSQFPMDEYRAILRNDLTSFIERSFMELNPQAEFIPGKYIELLASKLEKCRTGETKRLIINLPPRTLKSHAASVAYPAWLLGHDPSKQIICASYGQDLADKHARDCRTLISSGIYRSLFPGTLLSQSKNAVDDFMTTEQGFRMATSVGGVLTGRGADVIILDDVMKPDDALSEMIWLVKSRTMRPGRFSHYQPSQSAMKITSSRALSRTVSTHARLVRPCIRNAIQSKHT